VSQPKRTCIACRIGTDQADLLRLVRHPLDGSAVVDLKGSLPGRGAWVHPVHGCLLRLQDRPALLRRALKAEVRCDNLLDTARALTLAKILDGLSLVAASGRLVGGHDQLLDALKEGKLAALVFSENIADRTATRLNEVREPEVQTFLLPISSAALGFRVGKGPRAAVGLFASERSHWLIKQLQRRQHIG
jgi:predicted RNA-binding protein YlxR (DUF448 family)